MLPADYRVAVFTHDKITGTSIMLSDVPIEQVVSGEVRNGQMLHIELLWLPKAGETPEAALIRELKEELAIDVAESCLAPFTFASHRYEGFHLLMPLYLCRRWSGMVTPLEGQALAWVRPQKLAEYPMPPADKPLVALLRDFL